VTARAGHSGGRARAARVRRRLPSVVQLLGFAAALSAGSAARAEVGAVVSAFSDARFRGVSVSDGDPVGTLDLSYDDPSGAYAAASGTLVASSEGIKPLSLQLNAGYAKEVRAGLTLDLGIVQSKYSRYSTTVHGDAYTEAYAGLTFKSVTARVHLSPHYFESGRWTLYGELNHGLVLTRKLSLNSHVGLLVPVRSDRDVDSHGQFDWRVGLDRQLGRFALHAAFTGARGVRHYDQQRAHSGGALIVGASLIL